MTLPLAGITIVEAQSPECPLALRLASALAGRLAADLGATVVKVEPPGGDPVRHLPPLVGDESALFAFLNAGKRSVALSEDEAGRTALDHLTRRADAMIVDGGLQRARAEAAVCTPTVVLSLFGPHAADADRGSEFTVLARSGLLDIVGDPAREPLRLGGHQVAYAAGLAAYTGLVAALPGAAGPAADIVQVSLLDTAIWLNWKSAATAAAFGTVTTRAGRRANWPVVRCADGWIALVYQDADWPALCDLVGDPRLRDARFATQPGRVANALDFVAIVEQGFAGLTRRQIKQVALERRLPLGPVWELGDVLVDPQLLARNFFATVQRADGASMTMPRAPVIWNGRVFAPGAVPAAP